MAAQNMAAGTALSMTGNELDIERCRDVPQPGNEHVDGPVFDADPLDAIRIPFRCGNRLQDMTSLRVTVAERMRQ